MKAVFHTWTQGYTHIRVATGLHRNKPQKKCGLVCKWNGKLYRSKPQSWKKCNSILQLYYLEKFSIINCYGSLKMQRFRIFFPFQQLTCNSRSSMFLCTALLTTFFLTLGDIFLMMHILQKHCKRTPFVQENTFLKHTWYVWLITRN
jgi:hypothetical protein